MTVNGFFAVFLFVLDEGVDYFRGVVMDKGPVSFSDGSRLVSRSGRGKVDIFAISGLRMLLMKKPLQPKD